MLTNTFGGLSIIEVTEKPHYRVFELKALAGVDSPVFDLASLGLPATGHVGKELNIVWNPSFAVCLLALTREYEAERIKRLFGVKI